MQTHILQRISAKIFTEQQTIDPNAKPRYHNSPLVYVRSYQQFPCETKTERRPAHHCSSQQLVRFSTTTEHHAAPLQVPTSSEPQLYSSDSGSQISVPENQLPAAEYTTETRADHLLSSESRSASRKAANPERGNVILSGKHQKYPKQSTLPSHAGPSAGLNQSSSAVTVQSENDASNSPASSSTSNLRDPPKLHLSKSLSPDAAETSRIIEWVKQRVIEAEKTARGEECKRQAGDRFRELLAKWQSDAKVRTVEEEYADRAVDKDDVAEVKVKFAVGNDVLRRTASEESICEKLVEPEVEEKIESREDVHREGAKYGKTQDGRVRVFCMDRTREILHGMHNDSRRGLAGILDECRW